MEADREPGRRWGRARTGGLLGAAGVAALVAGLVVDVPWAGTQEPDTWTAPTALDEHGIECDIEEHLVNEIWERSLPLKGQYDEAEAAEYDDQKPLDAFFEWRKAMPEPHYAGFDVDRLAVGPSRLNLDVSYAAVEVVQPEADKAADMRAGDVPYLQPGGAAVILDLVEGNRTVGYMSFERAPFGWVYRGLRACESAVYGTKTVAEVEAEIERQKGQPEDLSDAHMFDEDEWRKALDEDVDPSLEYGPGVYERHVAEGRLEGE